MSDYISREAALKAFENADADVMEDYGDGTSDWGFGRGNIREILNSVPAADVEPVRHGAWYPCFEDWRQQQEGNKCSVCGFEYYGTGIRAFHYCPNCGAKMDLEVENDG